MPETSPLDTDLLARIPVTARTVLEIGPRSEALARAFHAFNPAATWYTEPEGPAAARRFDAIVWSTGPERLADPWSALAAAAARLAEGGTMLLLLPNAEHWSNAARLLRGAWDYTESGLQDRRHLRWFTRRTAEAALRAAGLAVAACIPRIFDARAARDFVAALAPALPALGLDPEELMARAAPLQYLLVATRGAPARLTLHSTMLAPQGGVSHVRVVEPLESLATLPGVTARIVPAPGPAPSGDAPRIFVFHRPAFVGPDGLAPVRDAIRRGWLVICEFDDHPDHIPILQTGEVHNFAAVHAVQTSTPTLATRLRRENPEVGVFPNMIRSLPAPRNFAAGPLTVFFAAINRGDEWPPLLDALNAAAAEARDALQFHIVGEHALFRALRTPRKRYSPMLDYAAYQQALAEAEISLMPLRDTEFNACKSDLKFIEAAAHRVVPLASRTVYAETIAHGRTGLLFDTQDELRANLCALAASPDRARAIADAARDYVASQRMAAYQVPARLAWYHDLWDRKPALDAALAARRPELFDTAPEGAEGDR